jgi:hypothetical protein
LGEVGINNPFTRAEFIKKHSYTYNDKGYVLRQRDSLMNGSLHYFEYEYDSLGNQTMIYDFNEDTTRLTITKKVYNVNNQLVTLFLKIQNFPLVVSRQYFYNGENKLWKEEALDMSGKIAYCYYHDYDTSMNKEIITFENKQGRDFDSEFFYNKDRLCVKFHKNSCTMQFNGKYGIGNDPGEYISEYIYNKDKTIFERDTYYEGKKIEIVRHYYSKDE